MVQWLLLWVRSWTWDYHEELLSYWRAEHRTACLWEIRLFVVKVMNNRFEFWDMLKGSCFRYEILYSLTGLCVSRIKYFHYCLISGSFFSFLLCLFVLFINLLHFVLVIYISWKRTVCCQSVFLFYLSLFVYEFNSTWLLISGFSNASQKVNSITFILRWHSPVVFSVIQNAFKKIRLG
jgi:hypothetical protein